MNQVKDYREGEIRGASGVQLVVIAYDGAIGNLLRARMEIEEKRSHEAIARILRAKKIVVYLLSCLNPEGGEVSTNLQRLYGFVLTKLSEAALDPGVLPVNAAIDVLQELRSAWMEVSSTEEAITELAQRDLSVSA